MSALSNSTTPVRRRTSRKLARFLFVAFLLPAVPASASGLPVWQHADAGTKGADSCALPPLSIRTDKPLVLSSSAANEAAGDFAPVENRWASGATSHWNAGMNRAVDQLVSPPDHVNVYATQTGGDLHGHFEGTNSPNETLAAFQIVIH